MRDELVAHHRLVQLAERPREPCARPRERLEARGLQQLRGTDVPRVGHHEELLLLVQLPEPAALFCGRHLLLSGAVGAPSTFVQSIVPFATAVETCLYASNDGLRIPFA